MCLPRFNDEDGRSLAESDSFNVFLEDFVSLPSSRPDKRLTACKMLEGGKANQLICGNSEMVELYERKEWPDLAQMLEDPQTLQECVESCGEKVISSDVSLAKAISLFEEKWERRLFFHFDECVWKEVSFQVLPEEDGTASGLED
ncbi:MAG: hypothetical protein IPL25_20325 [Saprospiraceae bacterium]|nr:hypothetical protein [Candidatus Vicinibacter affinis]